MESGFHEVAERHMLGPSSGGVKNLIYSMCCLRKVDLAGKIRTNLKGFHRMGLGCDERYFCLP